MPLSILALLYGLRIEGFPCSGLNTSMGSALDHSSSVAGPKSLAGCAVNALTASGFFGAVQPACDSAPANSIRGTGESTEDVNSQNVMLMLLSFGILLAVARLLGELAEKLHQPAVLGELLAGILLGPTVLGNMAPAAVQFLFPPQGPNAVALEALSTLAIVLFLLVAGIEVDLSTVWRQGNVGLKAGVVGMAVPYTPSARRWRRRFHGSHGLLGNRSGLRRSRRDAREPDILDYYSRNGSCLATRAWGGHRAQLPEPVHARARLAHFELYGIPGVVEECEWRRITLASGSSVLLWMAS